jgi:hypothetical protein
MQVVQCFRFSSNLLHPHVVVVMLQVGVQLGAAWPKALVFLPVQCIGCPKGSYANATGATQCIACTGGKSDVVEHSVFLYHMESTHG